LTLSSRRSLILGAGAAFIVRPVRALIYPRNPLAYPGGNPGFNQNHIAAGYVQFSGVAQGSSFLRLDHSNVPTLTGSPVASIDGTLGPVIGVSGTQVVTFGSSNGTTISNGFTLAAIIRNTSSATAGYVISDSALNVLEVTSTGITIIVNNTKTLTLASVLTSGHPYFIAVTVKNVTNNPVFAVFCDLSSSVITTASGNPGVTSQAAGSTVYVGNNASGTVPFTGQIAAAAILHNIIPDIAVVQWASAPWDFWYPPTEQSLLFSSIANPSPALPAFGGFMAHH